MHKVTNLGPAPRIFNVGQDAKNDKGEPIVKTISQRILAPGETGEFHLADGDSHVMKALVESGHVRFEKSSGAKPNGQKQLSLTAQHKANGVYSIVDSSGAEVMSDLSKEDAKAFNAMSDADKSQYVKKN